MTGHSHSGQSSVLIACLLFPGKRGLSPASPISPASPASPVSPLTTSTPASPAWSSKPQSPFAKFQQLDNNWSSSQDRLVPAQSPAMFHLLCPAVSEPRQVPPGPATSTGTPACRPALLGLPWPARQSGRGPGPRR